MIRREFIKKSIVGSVGLAAGANSFANDSFRGANDKIVLAIIGTGPRSMEAIVNCCKVNENVTIKTVCDVNSTKLNKAVATIEKEFGYRKARTRERVSLFSFRAFVLSRFQTCITIHN